MPIYCNEVIHFGYITENDFELQGDFPVSITTRCSQSFLDEIEKNDFWCYSPSNKSKIFGQLPNCTMSGVHSEEHGQLWSNVFRSYMDKSCLQKNLNI